MLIVFVRGRPFSDSQAKTSYRDFWLLNARNVTMPSVLVAQGKNRMAILTSRYNKIFWIDTPISFSMNV
jgi:hypothetical protein